MKQGKTFTVIFVILSLILFSGCSKSKKTFDTKPVSIKQFDTPPGADPSVNAELGGNGFKGEGWETNTNYNTIGNPNAVKGGSLVMSIRDFPVTLRTEGKDANSQFNDLTASLIYETLLNQDPVNDDYIPCLATHWQISEDKLTYKFRINPDARWADGKPVTSEDVIASWKLHVDPGILDPYINELFGGYEKPVAESKYIVSFKSKEKSWTQFLWIALALRILPAHYIGNISAAEYIEKYQFEFIPGSGPYIIDKNEIKKGQSIMIRRRSDYWAEKERFNTGINNFDLIRFEVNTDENLEFEKFKKGEVDVVTVNRSSWWSEKFDFDYAKRGIILKRRIFNENPAGISGLVFNMRKPPFDDIKIRKAFAYLYNRNKFIEKLFYNLYEPINSYFPSSVYENPSCPKIGFNPDSAAMLLAEAGWKDKNSDGYLVKDGKVFEMELPYTKGQERYLTIFQEDCKKAGIKLNLKELDGPTIFKLGNERNFRILPQSWTGQKIPNPEGMLTTITADAPNTPNWSGLKDSKIDELCEKYNSEYNKNERVKIIRQIDLIACNYQAWAFGWCSSSQRIAFQNKFGYPEGILGRSTDYLVIPYLWYNDPEKLVEYEDAIKDNTKTLPTGEVDNKYWSKVKESEENKVAK